MRGVSPYETLADEPAPRLVIDPPFPGPLAVGVFQAQYRVENLRIVPVFGAAAMQVSPRIGHLHVTVDDLPWWVGRCERQQHGGRRRPAAGAARGDGAPPFVSLRNLIATGRLTRASVRAVTVTTSRAGDPERAALLHDVDAPIEGHLA